MRSLLRIFSIMILFLALFAGCAKNSTSLPPLNKTDTQAKELFKEYQKAYLKKDYDSAKRYLNASCELGYNEACYAAAQHYMKAKNYKKAIAIYIKACDELSHPKACNQLGIFYLNLAYQDKKLNFAKKSFEASLDFFNRSCALGDALGCANLSKLYSSQDKKLAKFIRFNQNKADSFLKKACDIYKKSDEKSQNSDFERSCKDN